MDMSLAEIGIFVENKEICEVIHYGIQQLRQGMNPVDVKAPQVISIFQKKKKFP